MPTFGLFGALGYERVGHDLVRIWVVFYPQTLDLLCEWTKLHFARVAVRRHGGDPNLAGNANSRDSAGGG